MNSLLSYPYTYLFYPRFNVTGVETVTVVAGTYECWKMEILLTTNGDDVIGYLWYSPNVKNYVKLDMNVTVESVEYNVYVELASYSGQVYPAPPGGLFFLNSLIFYIAYQGSAAEEYRYFFMCGCGYRCWGCGDSFRCSSQANLNILFYSIVVGEVSSVIICSGVMVFQPSIMANP